MYKICAFERFQNMGSLHACNPMLFRLNDLVAWYICWHKNEKKKNGSRFRTSSRISFLNLNQRAPL